MIYRCPVPGCGYIFEVLTDIHCETDHGMTRKEVLEKYGKPKAVRINHIKMQRNLEMMIKVNPGDLRM